MGLAALAAAGAGAAMLMKKTKEINEEETFHVKETTENYRNTERGKYDKNSKGIYYSNGNYEAFARPEGVDDKHAYIVGSGLASLAAACFLVRDAQMPGDHIHILEAMDIAGGACDGIFDPSRGYIMRGGREMENHFECLWDLFHSIPSCCRCNLSGNGKSIKKNHAEDIYPCSWIWGTGWKRSRSCPFL